MPTVQDLVDVFEEIASPRLAESWDNVGLLVGDPAQRVERLLLAIDYTPAVAAEARSRGCQAVVAYHPPLFQAKKRVLAGDGIFEAIRDGIALYSPHTALDVAAGGTNDVLCDLFSPLRRSPLRAAPGLDGVGIGRVAEIEPSPRAALLDRFKRGLGLATALVGGPMEGDARRLAVCAGAGGELLDDALRARVDVFITGELRHHDVLRAARVGVTVFCALHSNSERVTLRHLAPRLEGHARLAGVVALLSEQDRDPLSFL